MASKGCLRFLRQINGLVSRPKTQALDQSFNSAQCRRSMATVSEVPLPTSSENPDDSLTRTSGLTTSASMPVDENPQPPNTVLTTIYSFPDMEPLQFAYYPQNCLHLPLRRDILHRAVVYEGDKTRQGTASTKWRDEVHGSHRKLYPQKGLGKARVGDKQSPIRRGGGVAFGPKPRDFSTKLNKKIYDLAWRTALSYRYRKGELVIVDRIRNLRTQAPYWIKQVFAANEWGNADGRSLLVSHEKRLDNRRLFTGMGYAEEEGRILAMEDVDVKDLLSLGRLVIEYDALNDIIRQHMSDLIQPVRTVCTPPEKDVVELHVD